MKTYYADINTMIRVTFTDNGEDDLADQAIDAAKMAIRVDGDECEDHGMEIVGGVHPKGEQP